MVSPNPMELAPARQGMSELPRHRTLHCRFYGTCLDAAVRRGWQDWTCTRCALLGEARMPSATVFANDQPRD